MRKCEEMYSGAIWKFVALVFAGICLFAATQPATAGVLLQDNFETGNLTKPQTGGGSWTGTNAGSGDKV